MRDVSRFVAETLSQEELLLLNDALSAKGGEQSTSLEPQ